MHGHRRERSRHCSGDSGAALVELALVAPLFIAVVWGLVTLTALARSRLQVATVAHAVMREVQAGVSDTAELTRAARAYARACGMARADAGSIVVELGEGSAGLGLEATGAFAGVAKRASGWKRVSVRARVRVPDSLRLLTGPAELRCENVCVTDCWKAPWSLVSGIFRMPDPRREGK